jgi:hypothetical protein
MLLQRDFYGTTDDGTNGAAGSLSVLDIGMTDSWTYDGKMRTLVVIELPRYLLLDSTIGLKWQQIPDGGFPDITAELYGLLPGSTGAAGTGGGSGPATGGGSIGPYSSGTIAVTVYLTISSNKNDYLLVPLGTGNTYLLNVTGNYNLTGLSGGTEGMIVTLINRGSSNTDFLNITNLDSSSMSANQFALVGGSTLTLSQYGSQTFMYSNTDQKWYAFDSH